MKNRISTEGVDARAALGREPKGEPSPRGRMSGMAMDWEGEDGKGGGGRGGEEIRRSREDGPEETRDSPVDGRHKQGPKGVWHLAGEGKRERGEATGQDRTEIVCSSARGSRTDRRGYRLGRSGQVPFGSGCGVEVRGMARGGMYRYGGVLG